MANSFGPDFGHLNQRERALVRRLARASGRTVQIEDWSKIGSKRPRRGARDIRFAPGDGFSYPLCFLRQMVKEAERERGNS